jgi:hypothetical protein
VQNDNLTTFNGGGESTTTLTSKQTIPVPSTPGECNYLLSIWCPGNGGLYLVTKISNGLMIKELATPYGLSSINIVGNGLTIEANYVGALYCKWSLIRIGF